MANFDTPYYLDNFEKQFRFSEYEDNQNYFLRLVYLIRRTEYAKYATPHGTYPALDVNVTAHNGKKIFRDAYDVFDGGRSFKLLSESARDRAPNDLPHVIQVEQIYGYAPSVTHTRGEQVDWQQPGYYDRSTAANYTPDLAQTYPVEFIELENVYRITFTAPPAGLVVGDMVRLRGWRPWTAATVEGEIFTEETPVIAIAGNTVDIEALPATSRIYPVLTGEGVIESSVPPSAAANLGGASLPTGGNVVTTFNRILNSATWYAYPNFGSTLRLEKLGDRKSPENMSPGATVERTYFYRSSGMPVQQTAFRVQRAGETVDTLDNNTQPTFAQYQAMVSNGDLLRPTGERIGQVLGDVWYKDSYWLRAQLQ